MPDHWVPLALLGRTHRYPLGRVAKLSALAGATHVAVSLVLGALLILIGLQFRATVEHVQNAVVGGLLLATGALFVALEISGRGHAHDHDHHDHHSHRHVHAHRRGLLHVIVPFGAAASPDLTILPVFLAATTAGAAAAVGALVVFAAVTIATMLGLTLFASFGGHQIEGRWLDRWGNLFTAAVLVAIGALVLGGIL